MKSLFASQSLERANVQSRIYIMDCAFQMAGRVEVVLKTVFCVVLGSLLKSLSSSQIAHSQYNFFSLFSLVLPFHHEPKALIG